jgi:hypothetical protein
MRAMGKAEASRKKLAESDKVYRFKRGNYGANGQQNGADLDDRL